MTVENEADTLFVIWNKSDAIVGYSGKINGEFKADVAVQPDTEYAKGELRCGFVSYNEEKDENELISEIVDVPAFKTKPKTTTTTTTEKPTTTTTTTVAPTTTTTTTAIAVTGVTLDKSTLSLVVGATGNLVATIAPSNASYKAVSYKSSDEEVATVDNTGKVTAVKAGTAEITVESLMDGSKTAKCELTVTAPTTTTTTTVAPTTTTTTTVAPTTTTTTTEPTTTTTSTSSTTTTTTTLNPSEPSDVPDAESEVPNTGL